MTLLTLVAQASGRTGDAAGHRDNDATWGVITERSRESAINFKAHSQDVVIENLGRRVHLQNFFDC